MPVKAEYQEKQSKSGQGCLSDFSLLSPLIRVSRDLVIFLSRYREKTFFKIETSLKNINVFYKNITSI